MPAMIRRRTCACASSTPIRTSTPTMSSSPSCLLPQSKTGNPGSTGRSSTPLCLWGARTRTILVGWKSSAVCGGLPVSVRAYNIAACPPPPLLLPPTSQFCMSSAVCGAPPASVHAQTRQDICGQHAWSSCSTEACNHVCVQATAVRKERERCLPLDKAALYVCMADGPCCWVFYR